MHHTIDQLLQQATAAFHQYKNIPGREKALFLKTIASELEAIADTLCTGAVEESHLPEARIRGELGRTTGQLRAFAALLDAGHWVQATIDTSDAERKPLPKPDVRKLLFPVGPVVVFGASNFPLAFSTAGGDTASALAAGCSVIVKSHPAHPRTSSAVAGAIARAIDQCQMPHFVFQHLEDSSLEAGRQLVLHPLTCSVAFTGSFQGGKALFDLAVSRSTPIPVFAEMGSVNPVLVLPDIIQHQPAVADTLAASVLQGVGQFCTNPGLLLTTVCDGLPHFLETLTQAIQKSAPAPMLHDGIASHYKKGKTHHLATPGVKALALVAEGAPGTGAPALAVVQARDFMANPALHEEVFGPFSLVVISQDQAELQQVVRTLQGQLTASVFGTAQDYDIFADTIGVLQNVCGRLIFNQVPTGVEVCKAMHHGGPFPATTDARFTSVGQDAIYRFVRPMCFQNAPAIFLPPALRDDNPLNIQRCVNNVWTSEKLSS